MLSVRLLGTGGATPYRRRTTPAALCTTSSSAALVDCGSGITQRLAEVDCNASTVDALLFTHFHADHCVDFPVFVLTSYLAGRSEPLEVYGPEGLSIFVDTMLRQLFGYIPKLIGGVTGTAFSINVKEVSPGDEFAVGDMRVRVGKALHSVPALAFRFESDNASATLSGDTEFSDDIIRLASGSDLLVHECPFPVSMGELPDHTTAEQVGVVASRARVGHLVLTHLFEEVDGEESPMYAEIGKNYSGPVTLGEDMMEIEVADGAVTVK